MGTLIDFNNAKITKEQNIKNTQKPKHQSFYDMDEDEWKGLKFYIEPTETKYLQKLIDRYIHNSNTILNLNEQYPGLMYVEDIPYEIETLTKIKGRVLASQRKTNKYYIVLDMIELKLLKYTLGTLISNLVNSSSLIKLKKSEEELIKRGKTLIEKLQDIYMGILGLYSTGLFD